VTSRRLPTSLGLIVSAASLALTTLLLYPIEQIAPPVSLSVHSSNESRRADESLRLSR
jgi:hypothetical protein